MNDVMNVKRSNVIRYSDFDDVIGDFDFDDVIRHSDFDDVIGTHLSAVEERKNATCVFLRTLGSIS
jgi:hypothetical protein